MMPATKSQMLQKKRRERAVKQMWQNTIGKENISVRCSILATFV